MRVLYVVHQYLPRHRAGVEIYTHSLARTLMRRGHEACVYCHEPALAGSTLPVRDEFFDGLPTRRVGAYAAGSSPSGLDLYRFSYRNLAIEQDFGDTLAQLRPDVVHVQHLKDLSAGLLGIAAEAGVPVVMTLHDYWGICPNAQFVRPHPRSEDGGAGKICLGTHWHLECGFCAAHRLGRPLLRYAAPLMIPLFVQRQRFIREQMRHVSLFIAPSDFLRRRYVAAGYPEDRFLTLEYGLEHSRLADALGEGDRPRNGYRGRFAYVGSLAWQKGVRVLVEAFARWGDVEAELRIWGNPHAFPEYVRGLRELARDRPNIRFEGELDSERVGEALAWADYLVVPSVWWENSPITIQEAYGAGVPVIASRLGALEEKVCEDVSGLAFGPSDAADLARVLRRTREEAGLLERLRAGLPRTVPMDEHAALLEDLYTGLRQSG